jgi:4-alpha-glucanotransferase
LHVRLERPRGYRQPAISPSVTRPASALPAREPRSSGILLHPTSLPGGTLGVEARRFVDWLAAAGQSWWQVLPLGPPDEHGSPYASPSAFAGWDGFLSAPRARVTRSERQELQARHGYWLDDWVGYAGGAALDAQVRFEREWQAVRRYASSRGVRVIGDLPLYVAAGSADVLAHPELFELACTTGAPPDYFSDTGQLWGNPCFDWRAHRAEGYRWWIERLRRALQLADVVRLDHFRGFVAYWAVPAGARTAAGGTWRRGPGRDLFTAAEAELGRLRVIAEDLGVVTPPVERLRGLIRAPGMRVLQFGFESDRSRNALSRHPEDCVAYTGTHDNDPLAAWWDSASARVRARASKQLAEAEIDASAPHWALVELAFTSRAHVAVAQLQDVLGLGAEARMNRPGSVAGNWSWRLGRNQLTDETASRLRLVTATTGRLPRARAGTAARRSRRPSARR